jgi:hypothetical protein
MEAPTLIRIVTAVLALAANAAAQSSGSRETPAPSEEKHELFNHVVSNLKKSEEALDVYERVERVETRKNASDPQSAVVKIARVIPTGTGMARIPLGPSGQPKDAATYRIELEDLEKTLLLAAQGGRPQRDALEKFTKKKKERNDLIDATRTAFLYTLVGSELRGDRVLSKYRMQPNPAYKSSSRFTSIYARVHGFVWIDEPTGQLARVEGEVTEDISLGLFLAKVYKGSHFMQERYEFAPDLWLPSFSQYDFDGRRFFSSFFVHERKFYSDYRYIGPPNEALLAIRAELNKSSGAADDP